MLDVGRGDAILIELPNGKNILVDTATKYEGKKTVYPFLKKKSIKKLDVMIITHNDGDHIGGAGYIIDNIKICEIWNIGETEDPKHKKSRHYRRHEEDRDRNEEALKCELEITPDIGYSPKFGEVELKILHLNGDFKEENDNSIVFKLIYKDFTVLFTGDIEECAQTEIKIHVDVYKVAHHGSRKYYKKFIDAVRPKVAVSSGMYVWDFQIDALYFPSRDLIIDLVKSRSKILSHCKSREHPDPLRRKTFYC